MRLRALCAGLAIAVALPIAARADGCTAARVDVADWPIVRSARVPGFTLRLPRSYVRTADTTNATGATATWSDGGRARFTLVHLGGSASAATDAEPGHAVVRCEERIGSATAHIMSFPPVPDTTPIVVRATIRWPDGETVEIRAMSAERSDLDRLIAAVRTVRRTGA